MKKTLKRTAIIRKAILGSIICAAFSSVAQPLLDRAYSREFDPDGQANFEQLQQIIKVHRPRTIDRLLPLLPKSWRRRHVLIFKSRSIQDADYLRPRVLLISPQAHLIMAFNGEPDQKGFESFETIRFTSFNGRSQFILESLNFPVDHDARERYLRRRGEWADLKEFVDRAALQSGPNPALCLLCHRQNPRPNWDHYAFWPGIYGQFDDMPLLTSQDEAVKYINFFDPTSGARVEIDNDLAASSLIEFIKRAPTMPRYRNLIDLKDQLPCHGRLDGCAKPGIAFSVPLSALTYDLSRLNTLRILDMITRSHQPRRNILKFLSVLWECESEKSTEGQVDDSMPKTYSEMKRLFESSDLPWEDFFMNFYSGPGNRLRSPRNYPSDATYLIIQEFINLRSHFAVNSEKYQASPTDRTTFCGMVNKEI